MILSEREGDEKAQAFSMILKVLGTHSHSNTHLAYETLGKKA